MANNGINLYGSASDNLSNPSLADWAQYVAKAAAAVAIKTTTYSITDLDRTISCSGTFSATLPSASIVAGREFTVRNVGTGTITVTRNAGDTIDGVATNIAIPSYGAITIVSNGTNWLVINGLYTDTSNYSFIWDNKTAAFVQIARTSDSTLSQTGNLSVGGNASVTANLLVDTNTFMVDATNNRVGILTTSPASALHVNGNSQLAGNLNVTGTLTLPAGTITSTMILDGTIVNGDINSSAAIDKTKINGTAITAADTSTVTPLMMASQIVAKSGPYTLTASDSVITATGAITITLPNATTSDISGRVYTIRNISTSTVTIARTSSQTIDGVASNISLAGKGSVQLISDGSNWIVLGGSYTDESSGRRIFTWDTVNSRWQTTYSDTGWRAVVQFDSTGTFSTGSFPGTSIAPYPGAAGGLFIRRVDNLVTFRLQSIALTTASMSSATTNRIWYWVSGFNPLSTHAQIALGFNGSSYVSVSLRASVGDQALEVDYPQTVAVNTLLNCNLYMPTSDAWPSSLPGVAQGSIPT